MLETLKAYQAWRRGEDDRPLADTGLNPAVIGKSIDWAIAEIEQKQALEQWIAAIADNHPQIPDWIQQSARSLLAKDAAP